MIAKFQDWYLKFCFDTLFAKARRILAPRISNLKFINFYNSFNPKKGTPFNMVFFISPFR